MAKLRNPHNIKYRQRRKAQKKATGRVTFGDNVDVSKPIRESSRIGLEELQRSHTRMLISALFAKMKHEQSEYNQPHK